MKSAAATLLLALATVSEAGMPNAYSRRILNSANNRHHIKYGYGGADFIQAHNSANAHMRLMKGKKLSANQKLMANNVVFVDGEKMYKIGGKYFDAGSKYTETIAFFYEMQFMGGEAFNSCTLCATELVETSEDIDETVKNFEFSEWFNVVAYYPNHYAANSMAIYEYCDFQQIFVGSMQFFPTDYSDWTTYNVAGISQTLTTWGTAAFSEAVPLQADLAFAAKSGDYMAVGQYSGAIFKMFFSFSLDQAATKN